MRRFGGIVLSASLAIAGCTAAGSTDVSRSTVSPPPDEAAPQAELASQTTTSTTPKQTPKQQPDATSERADSGPVESPSATLDPVPAGTRESVRAASASPPPPSGPRPTGHIEIPTIGLSHTTYDGIDLATLNHGPGHWPGTARPGHAGNTVFPGHRTTYTRPFWDIDLLRAGDQVIFTTAEGRFVYRVTDTFIVDDEETWIVRQTNDATFTIFGCHPKGSAAQRYVAKGELVSPPATTTTTTTRPPETTTTTTEPEDDDDGLIDLFD